MHPKDGFSEHGGTTAMQDTVANDNYYQLRLQYDRWIKGLGESLAPAWPSAGMLHAKLIGVRAQLQLPEAVTGL
jgi:hypothetical protein